MNWVPMIGMAVYHQATDSVAIVRQQVASDRYRIMWVTGSDRGWLATVDLTSIAPMAEHNYEAMSAELGRGPVQEDPALSRVRRQIKHSRNIARVTMLPEVREIVDAMCDDIEAAIKG